jgi:hypothetical protein
MISHLAATAINVNVDDSSSLVVIMVAAIPAVAAIFAAIAAARSSKNAQKGDADAHRIRDLENRLSDQKFQTYKPMVELIGNMFSQDEASQAALRDAAANVPKFKDFTTWITIYGSDEAVTAWHNFMAGAKANPPLMIKIRLLTDVLLAARKDMGYPDSKVTRQELIATRLTDFYDQEDKYSAVLTLPFAEACKLANWTPPWEAMSGKIKLDADGNEIVGPPGLAAGQVIQTDDGPEAEPATA